MKLRDHPQSNWSDLLWRAIPHQETKEVEHLRQVSFANNEQQKAVLALGECIVSEVTVTAQDPTNYIPAQVHFLLRHQGKSFNLAHALQNNAVATWLCRTLNAKGLGRTLYDIGDLDIV